MEQIKKIKDLIDTLNVHRDNYYNKQKPTISDYEYDKLYDELLYLEKQLGVVFSNSPTQTVGYEVKSELQKVKHSHPMLSLDKTKSAEDLKKFAGDKDFILSLKMDGLTVLLTYDNGKLVQAETRGNGEVGEDITHNAFVFENIPLKIDYNEHLEIEGEAIITYDDFEQINSLIKNDDDKYKNPRNLVSGSVRQLDSSVAAKRHIKFIAWKVPTATKSVLESFYDIEQLGFDIVPYVCTNDTEHIDYLIKNLKEIALKKSYPIDGLVMTYDDIAYGKSLGHTGHHPRHSIAYKFYDEEVETTLLDIEWTMGKTGTLCPIAVFEPVEIDGTTVAKASLHNISVMRDELGIVYRGQKVFVFKANQIIPQISYADQTDIEHELSFGGNLIYPPRKCPICGAKTERRKDNDTEVLYCTSDSCSGKMLGKLNAFVSKQGMDINGLSEATLQLLLDRGYVSSFKDLYYLSEYKAELSGLPKMGAKSVAKLLKSIEDSRKVTLDRFLTSLSIPLLGKSTCKDIAKYCHDSIDEFIFIVNNTILEFMTIDGIGRTMIDSLDDWWNENAEMVFNLIEELEFESFEEDDDDVIKTDSHKLDGMTFVVTGSVHHFKNRTVLQTVIEQLGGKVVGSVSAKTSVLINNDVNSNSSKNVKAKSLNIPIWTEDDFLKYIEN